MVSQFKKLLQRLQYGPEAVVITIPLGELPGFHVGGYVEHDGQVWKIERIHVHEDWFNETALLYLRNGTNPARPPSTRVVWLEDKFLPSR